MQPLHPDLREALKRTYPGLTDEIIDHYEELTNLRFILDPKDAKERINEIDEERKAIVIEQMPFFAEISRTFEEKNRKTRERPAARVEIKKPGIDKPDQANR